MMQGISMFAVIPIAPEGSDISTWTVLKPLELLSAYMPAFVAALVATLVATPIVRRVALATNIIDHPDQGRKQHAYPIAYLGGLAIFVGTLVGIGVSAIFSSGQSILTRYIR